jgi:restriction system protein
MARRGKTGSFDDLIALPLACLLGALASALRRRRRNTLADNVVAAVASADPFQAVKPGDEPAATTEITAPVCPQCLGPMVRRVAGKGASTGEAFWGCALFPKCRGTM